MRPRQPRPNGRLYVWKLKDDFSEDGEVAVPAHSGRVDALAFTSAGLWSLGLDGNLKLWSQPDAKELATHSFGRSSIAAGCWPTARWLPSCVSQSPENLELHRVPKHASDKPELLGKIAIVGLFDGFPTVHREFTVPQLALSPDWQTLALAAKSGSNDLAINQVAIYDVSAWLPKRRPLRASQATRLRARRRRRASQSDAHAGRTRGAHLDHGRWRFQVEAQFAARSANWFA